ncbi:FkbM family methyltransferase [Luteibacter anthropi]|uniref:FkbM family methyltransferase n=1 Tax=Luteibacter anthropi TaxID=564369 RepID=UPI002033118A|nr:FkbM family methyltransferase [Luteibacter anthropi]URX63038.1 FkbM family methyltransferase [Luteibacter anthropi]
MSMISYAQNYEDVMLSRALAGVKEGFYVDVGAQHPINGSVTKAFHLKGWRGINIEPIERWFRLVCADRPLDVNLQVPISDVPGTIEIFDVEDTGLSTVRADYAANHAKDGWHVEKRQLEAKTLNEVFGAYAAPDVHFLKVDVEGAEGAVLRSIDLRRYRPWILLVEATKPNSSEPSFEDWEPIVLEQGYCFVYDDGLNRFYLAEEHADLSVYFQRPPNFFDDFIPYAEWWVRQQLDAANSELSGLKDISRLADTVEAQGSRMDTLPGAIRNEVSTAVGAWGDRLEAGLAELAARLDGRFDGVESMVEQRTAELGKGFAERLGVTQQKLDARVASTAEKLGARLTALGEGMDARMTALRDRLDARTNAISEHLDDRGSAITDNVIAQMDLVRDKIDARQDDLSEMFSSHLGAFRKRIDALRLNEHLEGQLGALSRSLESRLEVLGGGLDDRLRETRHMPEMLMARMDAVEKTLVEAHARFNFAANVQEAYLQSAERARAAEATLDLVLHSRSWRITRAPRVLAREIRRLICRDRSSAPVRQINVSVSRKPIFVRMVRESIKNPLLRKIGAVTLRFSPGLKRRIVGVALSHEVRNVVHKERISSAESSSTDAMHLPARARLVRAMLTESSSNRVTS